MIRIFLTALILGACSLPCWAIPGAGEVRQGNEAYRKGDYKAALKQYDIAAEKSPSEAKIDHDKAAAFYKDGRFKDAIESWNKALLTDDEKLRRNIHYDLGNAFYKNGTAREDADIDGAIKDVTSSLAEYGTVMTADAKDEDARKNQTFVAKELERLKLKKQQLQQQQQQNQQKQDQSQQQQKDRPDQAGQGEQKKPQQGRDQNRGEERSRQEQGQNKQDQQKQDAGQGDQIQKDASGKKKDSRPEQDKKPSDQKDGAAGQKDGEKILSRDEAEMLLNDFDQNEQPKGLLNFTREQRQEKPVGKDW